MRDAYFEQHDVAAELSRRASALLPLSRSHSIFRASLMPLGASSVAIVALAIYAVVRDFSPVPYWDMWNGYLEFFLRLADGDTSVWWSQHNEHRVIVPRLVFWADIRWCGGLGILPLVVIHLGAIAMAGLLWRAMASLNRANPFAPGALLAGFGLLGWFCLGAQFENQRWPFQVCFTLAQLLPLCASCLLYRSTRDESRMAFAVACLAGTASAGTLATGILILPLMTVYLVLTRGNAWRIATLAGLSVVVAVLYRTGYTTVTQPGHDSPLTSLLQHPLLVARFFLSYLGSPIEYLIRPDFHHARIAPYAGWLFVVGAGFAVRYFVLHDRGNRLRLALLVMLAYSIASALSVACGRASSGEGSAMSSRYTTATLTAWAVLLVLLSTRWQRASARRPVIVACVAAIAFGAMLRLQLWSLDMATHRPAAQNLAGLALAMQVDDDATLATTFPRVRELQQIASRGRSAGLSFFALEPYRDVARRLGSVEPQAADRRCDGATVALSPIPGDPRHLHISGSFVDPRRSSTSPSLTVVDARARIVGFAVTGFEQGILFEPGASLPARTTYRGYVDEGLADGARPLALVAPGCSTRADR